MPYFHIKVIETNGVATISRHFQSHLFVKLKQYNGDINKIKTKKTKSHHGREWWNEVISFEMNNNWQREWILIQVRDRSTHLLSSDWVGEVRIDVIDFSDYNVHQKWFALTRWNHPGGTPRGAIHLAFQFLPNKTDFPFQVAPVEPLMTFEEWTLQKSAAKKIEKTVEKKKEKKEKREKVKKVEKEEIQVVEEKKDLPATKVQQEASLIDLSEESVPQTSTFSNNNNNNNNSNLVYTNPFIAATSNNSNNNSSSIVMQPTFNNPPSTSFLNNNTNSTSSSSLVQSGSNNSSFFTNKLLLHSSSLNNSESAVIPSPTVNPFFGAKTNSYTNPLAISRDDIGFGTPVNKKKAVSFHPAINTNPFTTPKFSS